MDIIQGPESHDITPEMRANIEDYSLFSKWPWKIALMLTYIILDDEDFDRVEQVWISPPCERDAYKDRFPVSSDVYVFINPRERKAYWRFIGAMGAR